MSSTHTWIAYAPRGAGLLAAVFYFEMQAHVYGWFGGSRDGLYFPAFFMLEDFHSPKRTRLLLTEGTDIYSGWSLQADVGVVTALNGTIAVDQALCVELDRLQGAFWNEWLTAEDAPDAAPERAAYEGRGLPFMHVNIKSDCLNRLDCRGPVWHYRSPGADANVLDGVAAHWPLDYPTRCGGCVRPRRSASPTGETTMQIPLRITFQDMPHSAAVEQAVQEKVEKLERFYPHLIGCHVTVQTLGKHKHQGKQFTVHINLTAPGKEIVVNLDHDEDIYVAIRDAFDSARRQLEDYARIQRGDSKAHEPEHLGHIARTFPDEGYGFIEANDGREYYFSGDNLENADLGDLKPGTPVRFLEQAGSEGLQARRVSIGKHMTRP